MTKLDFERMRRRLRPHEDVARYGFANQERIENCPPDYGPLPPNLTFKGDFAAFVRIVDSTGMDGTWSPGQFIVYRTEGGAVMNWAPRTGTIWFQGKQPFVRDLHEAVEIAIGRWHPSQKSRSRNRKTPRNVAGGKSQGGWQRKRRREKTSAKQRSTKHGSHDAAA